MKIVVIGGVAAGMSAAAKARRIDKNAQVLVFEQGQDVSYGACGLPYFISGKNPDSKKLYARSVETFSQQDIGVHLHCKVTKLHADKKQVTVVSTQTGEEWLEDYDRLMIATGAEAIRPPLPGVNLPGVHTLKTLADGLALRTALKEASRVVVAGGGYIGVEAAESLREAGFKVCLAEAGPHLLGAFDPEIREHLYQRLVEKGVNIRLNAPVLEITQKPDGTAGGIRTAQGTCPADAVILAMGVRPATSFLQGSDIVLAKNGAIVVDRRQRTNLPDVFAAGDCALAWNPVEDAMVYSPLGTVANKCGRIAGENLAGGNAEFPGCLGSAAIVVCGLEAGRTGLSEEAARRKLKHDIQVAFIESTDHPAYYPTPAPIWIKLVCQKSTGRILGGQTCGKQGAALRCQTIAMAITANATAQDLGWADLGYAPPFSKAWDALNIAGNAIK